MSIKQFFRIVWARKWLVLTLLVLVSVAGTATTLLLPKQYTADTALVVEVRIDPVLGALAPSLAAPGYNEEKGAKGGSDTETFVALRAEIDNWRWAGVPFYLRTGKRMQRRSSEIVIHFKSAPYNIFSGIGATLQHRVDEALALEFALGVQDREQHFPRRLAEAVVGRAPQYLRAEKHGRRGIESHHHEAAADHHRHRRQAQQHAPLAREPGDHRRLENQRQHVDVELHAREQRGAIGQRMIVFRDEFPLLAVHEAADDLAGHDDAGDPQ